MAWQQFAAPAIGAAAGALFGDDQEHFGFGDKYAVDSDSVDQLVRSFSDLQTPEYYPGQTYADMNPATGQALDARIGYAQGMGGDIADLQFQTGQAGANALTQGVDYLGNAMGGQAPQFQFDQGTFDTTMQNLMPGMQGTYDNATRDIDRNLNYNTLPGLNMGAAMGGNMASSALGNNSTLAQGFAQDRKADIGSQIYQNAINQAQGAGMGAGGQNLNAGLSNQQQLLGASGSLASQGLPTLANANVTSQGNINQLQQGGQGYEMYDQQGITDEVNRFNFNQNAPWETAANKVDLYNATSMTPSPTVGNNTFGNAVQGAQFAGGLYDAYKGTQNQNPLPYLNYPSMPAAGNSGILGQQGVNDWYTQRPPQTAFSWGG